MEPKFKIGDKAVIIPTNQICEITDLCDDNTHCHKVKIVSSNDVQCTAYYPEEQLKPMKESLKFKNGDKVKIISDGNIGIVEGLTTDILYFIKADNGSYYCEERNLELVQESPKFKVGDYVKVIKKITTFPYWNNRMDNYINNIYPIEQVFNTSNLKWKVVDIDFYYYKINGYLFTEESLELAEKPQEFKIGDYVLVTRKPTGEERLKDDDYWGYWDCKLNFIAQVGVITERYKNGYTLKFSEKDVWSFPTYVLEKVNPPKFKIGDILNNLKIEEISYNNINKIWIYKSGIYYCTENDIKLSQENTEKDIYIDKYKVEFFCTAVKVGCQTFGINELNDINAAMYKIINKTSESSCIFRSIRPDFIIIFTKYGIYIPSHNIQITFDLFKQIYQKFQERYNKFNKENPKKEVIYKPGDKFVLNSGTEYTVVKRVYESGYDGYKVKYSNVSPFMFLDKLFIEQNLLRK